MEKLVGGSKTHERQKNRKKSFAVDDRKRLSTTTKLIFNRYHFSWVFFHFDFLDKQTENLGISKKTMSRIWNYTCPNTAFLKDTKKLPHRFVIQRQNQTKLVLQSYQTPLLNIPDGAVFLATLSPPPLPKIKYKKHIHISTRLNCTRHQHVVI